MRRSHAAPGVAQAGPVTRADHADVRPVQVRVVVVRAGALSDGLAEGVLSEAERVRARAHRRPEDRRLSATASALVRVIAGQALGARPESVTVTRRCPACGGPHGAPFVDGAPLLSVSHGDGFAVVAACDLPVGVDVEPVGRVGVGSVAGVLLGPHEPPSDDAGLLRTWVRKEAVVKATGVGLTVPLSDVRVSAPHEPAAVVRYGPRPGLAIALADVPLGGAHLSVAVVTDRQIQVLVEDGASWVTR
ncbi:4'-phosphopantetheinyl transferase family protein [Xylanimonas ulmi]|uniref:4'-phosphopantetheinyl transferase n=1 Tax=Xylanimonas ulmi TaxID=228973 RepID=A0A4Q7M3N4_9MICO|nr:4'-phosphopantetheinyl transferase superfamily protein [Xylanibacterium ulmi]RZS61108.1 4'-phosphopantetheinyl transferase [Xylanibacterium ulmi]